MLTPVFIFLQVYYEKIVRRTMADYNSINKDGGKVVVGERERLLSGRQEGEEGHRTEPLTTTYSYDEATYKAHKRRYWRNLWTLSLSFTFVFSAYLSLQVNLL